MKKHLIAAAVAATLAVPAMAQVSISGRIDTSITTTSKNSVGSSQTTIASGIISTNQLVLKGAEGLGGALRLTLQLHHKSIPMRAGPSYWAIVEL